MHRWVVALLTCWFLLHAGAAPSAWPDPCCEQDCHAMQCIGAGCSACSPLPAMVPDAVALPAAAARHPAPPGAAQRPADRPQPVWCPPD